jgi:hypothetical protein
LLIKNKKMENNTKIGIGVLVLAGVGYYFYNKNKSPMPNVSSTTVNEPKKTGFDREKASKELAVLFFPLGGCHVCHLLESQDGFECQAED